MISAPARPAPTPKRPPKRPGLSYAQLVRSVARESFEDFVRIFWGAVIQDPLEWNWHMTYLCREAQDVLERVFRRQPKEYDLIVNISPGTSKSTIFSVMLPAWAFTRMPHIRTIGGSYTQPLALELSQRCRDVVRSDLYQAAFPEVELRRDQNTKSHWKTMAGGSRYACTVGGSVTGMHAHLQIVDDPLDPRGARSKEEVRGANYWMTETLPSRKVNKEVTPLIVVMQRLHQDDPTGHLLAKKPDGFRHICLPAEVSQDVRPLALRRLYKDGLMDPVRLSAKVLAEARLDLGAFGYAGQYGQRPIPLGDGMFNVDKLQRGRPPGLGVPNAWEEVVRYWDKAGTQDDGCYSCGVLMGRLTATAWAKLGGPRHWVLHVTRGQWGVPKREQNILETAKKDGYDVVVCHEQEPGSGGKESAEATTKRLSGFRVRVDKVTGDKFVRAEPLAGAIENGDVGVVDGPWLRDYLDELKYFGPTATYLDQGDASAGAYNELTRKKKRLGAAFRGKR